MVSQVWLMLDMMCVDTNVSKLRGGGSYDGSGCSFRSVSSTHIQLFVVKQHAADCVFQHLPAETARCQASANSQRTSRQSACRRGTSRYG